MIEKFKIIRTKKAIQVRFNEEQLYIDSKLYQFKLYVRGHYLDNPNCRILKDGYSFGVSEQTSLDDWFNEFTESSKLLTKQNVLLF